jgi:hypothetical protein
MTAQQDFEALDGRRRVEQANPHLYLRTFAPGEPGNPHPEVWAFAYWTDGRRVTEDWPAENGMVERLFTLFGRPGAEE